MSVKLISYSQPPPIGSENKINNDTLIELVAYCARVSNPENQELKVNNDKLVMYLMKNNHWSPFEMVSICLEINTTRDIARQLLRHRSFSFQEFSQRYAEYKSEFIIREPRLQDHKNRQSSIDISLNSVLHDEWKLKQEQVSAMSTDVYTWALQNGIAKEQARVVLPEGMTASKLYVNGTLRSWIHYIELRTAPGTQKEHRELATECKQVISTIIKVLFLSI